MVVYGLLADVEKNRDKGVQLYVPGKTRLKKGDIFLGGPGTGITDEMIGPAKRIYGTTAQDTADVYSNYLRQPQELTPKYKFRPGAKVTMAMKKYLDDQDWAERDYQTSVNQWNSVYEAERRQEALDNAFKEAEYTGRYKDEDTLKKVQWDKEFGLQEKDFGLREKVANDDNAYRYAALASSDYNNAADRRISQQNANTSEMNVTGVYPGSRAIPPQYSDWVNDAAQQYGLDPALLAGLIDMESSWNPNAVNRTSGATGLGQFLPSTAADEGLADPTDPQSSIYAAAKYLAKRIDWAGGDVNKGIMGYGEGTTEYLNKVLNAQKKYAYGNAPAAGKQTAGERANSATADAIEAVQRDAPNMTRSELNTSLNGIMGQWVRDGVDMKVIQEVVDSVQTRDEIEAAQQGDSTVREDTLKNRPWWQRGIDAIVPGGQFR